MDMEGDSPIPEEMVHAGSQGRGDCGGACQGLQPRGRTSRDTNAWLLLRRRQEQPVPDPRELQQGSERGVVLGEAESGSVSSPPREEGRQPTRLSITRPL